MELAKNQKQNSGLLLRLPIFVVRPNVVNTLLKLTHLRIEDVIKQYKFINPQHKAVLNLIYTSGDLVGRNTRLLRPYNLSQQQFNILRILRGRHPEPATVKLLTERMLDRMSNASRLVDKLKQKGLVERTVCADDRRRVDIFITEKGLKTVAEASEIIEKDMRDIADSITDEEAIVLSNLLDKLRFTEE